jgi:CTP:molybdopterin cytidylyltransferase MocA
MNQYVVLVLLFDNIGVAAYSPSVSVSESELPVTVEDVALEQTLEAVRGAGFAWHIQRFTEGAIGDALAEAVDKSPVSAGWLVLPGRFPLLKSSTLKTISKFVTRDNSVVPMFKGEYGYPIGFGLKCKQRLISSRDVTDLHSISRKLPLTELSVNDVGIEMLVDSSLDHDDLNALMILKDAGNL